MHLDGTGPATGGFSSELKFVVDAEVGRRIRDWARDHLGADPHGGGAWCDVYRVSSLYFDTDARDVFHRRRSFGRSKYRIRRYEQDATVFLERKLRNGSRLAKRRTGIDVATLQLIAERNAVEAFRQAEGDAVEAFRQTERNAARAFRRTGSTLNGDVTAWFQRRVALRELRPVCQVSYTRIARMANTSDGPARLTLDEDITALTRDSFSFATSEGTSLLDGRAIVELKYRHAVPAIFKEAVETFALTPARWSKYRAAAEALGLVPPRRPRVPSPSHG